MSLPELALSMVILALAMLPVFGLVTGELARSSIASGVASATRFGGSVMDELLSDSLPFRKIPVSPAGSYRNPAGSVAAAPSLDSIFRESGWVRNGTARSITRDGIQYQVYLWTGLFSNDDDLSFHYLQTPDIRYSDATPSSYYSHGLRLKAADWPYSPYNPANPHNAGAGWASTVITKNQWELSPAGSATPHNAQQSFMKLVIQVVWSPQRVGRFASASASKYFWLVSFRANLEDQ